MEKLIFCDATHEYFIDGVKKPSVTDICEPLNTGLTKLPKYVLENARQMGTAIHEYANALACDIEDLEVTTSVINYAKWFKSWWNAERPKVIFAEVKLFGNDFCGTADLVAEISGITYLIDYKTSSVMNKVSLSAQLYGYKALLESKGIKIDKCACLHIKKDNYPTFKEIEPDKQLFESLLYVWQKLNIKEKKNAK